MIYLLDTNMIIYWVKGNPVIKEKIAQVGFSNIAASDITRAELLYGAYKSEKKDKNLNLIHTIGETINFLPFNEHAQHVFARQKVYLERRGTRLDDMDLMILGTALAYNLTLVTNDVKHFSRVDDLKIQNWII